MYTILGPVFKHVLMVNFMVLINTDSNNPSENVRFYFKCGTTLFMNNFLRRKKSYMKLY